MKYLGLDYGEAKIGLAISEGELAQPYGVLPIFNFQFSIFNLCRKEKIDKLIIGISEGQIAEKTRVFGKELAKITKIPVEYQDETLTSQKAQEVMIEMGKPRMKKKSSEHAIAAALILQDYLDNLRG